MGGQDAHALHALRGERVAGKMRCKVMSRNGRPVGFMCGSFPERKPCQAPGCPNPVQVLCDFPAGEGKTCDTAVCRGHCRKVGEDRDYCFKHEEGAAHDA